MYSETSNCCGALVQVSTGSYLCSSCNKVCKAETWGNVKALVEEAEANASLTDEATLALLYDIDKLRENAANGLYHDFHKNGAELPKMQLHKDLLAIDAKMQDGVYDN